MSKEAASRTTAALPPEGDLRAAIAEIIQDVGPEYLTMRVLRTRLEQKFHTDFGQEYWQNLSSIILGKIAESNQQQQQQASAPRRAAAASALPKPRASGTSPGAPTRSSGPKRATSGTGPVGAAPVLALSDTDSEVGVYADDDKTLTERTHDHVQQQLQQQQQQYDQLDSEATMLVRSLVDEDHSDPVWLQMRRSATELTSTSQQPPSSVGGTRGHAKRSSRPTTFEVSTQASLAPVSPVTPTDGEAARRELDRMRNTAEGLTKALNSAEGALMRMAQEKSTWAAESDELRQQIAALQEQLRKQQKRTIQQQQQHLQATPTTPTTHSEGTAASEDRDAKRTQHVEAQLAQLTEEFQTYRAHSEKVLHKLLKQQGALLEVVGGLRQDLAAQAPEPRGVSPMPVPSPEPSPTVSASHAGTTATPHKTHRRQTSGDGPSPPPGSGGVGGGGASRGAGSSLLRSASSTSTNISHTVSGGTAASTAAQHNSAWNSIKASKR